MKLSIELINGRWLVNGKRLENMNQDERNEIDNHIRDLKAQIEVFELLDQQRIQLEKPRFFITKL